MTSVTDIIHDDFADHVDRYPDDIDHVHDLAEHDEYCADGNCDLNQHDTIDNAAGEETT